MHIRIVVAAIIGVLGVAFSAAAEPLSCNVSGYKAQTGLTASVAGDVATVNWSGANQQELRASFAVVNAAPVIRELSVRTSGTWRPIAANLTPEFRIVSGVRRMSNQQMQQAAQQLPLDKMTLIVVGDLAKVEPQLKALPELQGVQFQRVTVF